MTRQQVLARALREMAKMAESGAIAGASAIWLHEGGGARAVIYTPDGKDRAAALFAGLATNAAIFALAAGLAPQEAQDIIGQGVREALQRQESA